MMLHLSASTERPSVVTEVTIPRAWCMLPQVDQESSLAPSICLCLSDEEEVEVVEALEVEEDEEEEGAMVAV